MKQLLQKLQEVQLNSATNAEMFAVQSLNAELTQAMPGIQQQAVQAATQAIGNQKQPVAK